MGGTAGVIQRAASDEQCGGRADMETDSVFECLTVFDVCVCVCVTVEERGKEEAFSHLSM